MSTEKKTRRKKGEEALILAIACGATIEAAAKRAGVNVRTAYRRLRQETFSERVKELQQQMTKRSLGMLIAAKQLAAKTMISLMDETTPPATRLGAAKSVYGNGSLELEDLADEVHALKQEMMAFKKINKPKNGDQT